MARPKKENELNHYHFVSVRLSDIELENVDNAATTAGLSRSEYIRRTLLNQEISVKYEIVACIQCEYLYRIFTKDRKGRRR